MWTYVITNGALRSPDGETAGFGYSGIAEGLNNPDKQSAHDLGPIPEGDWTIGRFFDDPGGKGPLVAHLTPAEGTETHGRSGFMVHGDNKAMNHTASHGCIILNRNLREMLIASSDRTLQVVSR